MFLVFKYKDREIVVRVWVIGDDDSFVERDLECGAAGGTGGGSGRWRQHL